MNYKDKTVCVVDNGLFVSIAQMLAKSFGRVLYYTPWQSAFPTSNTLIIGDGLPGITRIKYPWNHLEDVDLWVFPDVYFSDMQTELVRQGKRVWGARRGDALELYRPEAKELFRKLGLSVNGYEVVRGLDALREYLKEHENVWVKVSLVRGDMETWKSVNYGLSEPRLDELEHRLGAKKNIEEFLVEDDISPAVEIGYDGFTVDGQFSQETSFFGVETKDVAYIGAVKRYDELPDAVLDVNAALAPWFKKQQYRGFFSSELRITEDGEVFMIDPCCFSEDTEVLTDAGWKKFQDLMDWNKVCTLNPETRAIEYHSPSRYIAYPYSGDMVHITSKKGVLDLLVTPNHSIWVEDAHKKDGRLIEVQAQDANGKYSIPRTGIWTGTPASNIYTIPRYESEWISGRKNASRRKHIDDSVDIDIKTWIAFMAMFLTEGNCSRWCVNIAQTKYKNEFRKVIESMPFKWTENAKGFRIFSVQLCNFLKFIPDRSRRGIPKWIKMLPTDLINLFLDWYALGDGTMSRGQRIFTTTSKQTADDLQELCLKAGFVADVTVKASAGIPVAISGGKYITKHDSYLILERKVFMKFYFEGWKQKRHEQYLKRVPYEGWVYDVEVKNHILYVRRNGKACWSGNCRAGSPPSEVYQDVYSNWPDIMWHGAEGVLIEPEATCKFGVEAMIHSAWADKNWQAIEFPPEVEPFVKLRNLTKIDGKFYVVPTQCGLPEIGAVIGLGDTLQEAVDHLVHNAEQVKGYYVDIKLSGIDEALEEVKNGQENYGIQFDDSVQDVSAPVPEPVSG